MKKNGLPFLKKIMQYFQSGFHSLLKQTKKKEI